MLRQALKAGNKRSAPLHQQVRWTPKAYVQPTTAKMDENFPMWMDEYAFDDLPYTRRDIFFFNETPIRQHRLIEAKIMARLVKEGKVPKSVLPMVKEIFVSPREEDDRLNELYWKIKEILQRTHPRVLEEKAKEFHAPIVIEDVHKLSSAIRERIRMVARKTRSKSLCFEVLAAGSKHEIVKEVRAEFAGDKGVEAIGDSDLAAVAVTAAIQSSGGPVVHLRFGRQAAYDPYYPNPSKDSPSDMRQRLPGFTDKEIAALTMVNSLHAGNFSRSYLSNLVDGGGLKSDSKMESAVKGYIDDDLETLKADFAKAFQRLQEMGCEKELFEAPVSRSIYKDGRNSGLFGSDLFNMPMVE